MERQSREARAAKLAAEASTARNGPQRNQDADSPAPDDDAPMSILPVHDDELAEDLAERSPSPDAPARTEANPPTSTNQPGTPPRVSVSLA